MGVYNRRPCGSRWSRSSPRTRSPVLSGAGCTVQASSRLNYTGRQKLLRCSPYQILRTWLAKKNSPRLAHKLGSRSRSRKIVQFIGQTKTPHRASTGSPPNTYYIVMRRSPPRSPPKSKNPSTEIPENIRDPSRTFREHSSPSCPPCPLLEQKTLGDSKRKWFFHSCKRGTYK